MTDMKINLNTQYINKFKIEKYLITYTETWLISLRPLQPTIGSLVLSVNRKCKAFSDLNENEGSDLIRAFKIIEKLYKNTLKPNKINYLALMMVDEQVHYHVIPRYKSAIQFNKEEYIDKNWPGPPELTPLEFSSGNFIDLSTYLKQNI
jgi:diadenosine tetraphosphate (Ap4A) HIT family hydrolase